MQERSAGTIVFRGSPPQFLLLHYTGGHWDFPKGNIEQGENPQQTALRELAEETGITEAKIIPGFQGKISYFYRRKGETVYKEVMFFLIATSQKEVTISHEHVGWEWLPYEEALKKLTFENARTTLKKAYEFLKSKNLV